MTATTPSNTPTNRNTAIVQQMLADLKNEVAGIPLMLTTFDTRITKLELRMDKAEDEQKQGKQWANDTHNQIKEQVVESERRIMAKLEEKSNLSWGTKFAMLSAAFGWVLVIIGYIFSYILSRH